MEQTRTDHRGAEIKETACQVPSTPWKATTLQDVCLGSPQNGAFIKKAKFGSGILYVNVYDIYQNPVLASGKVERVEWDDAAKERYLLRNGDLLFVRSSLKREGVGQCCVITNLEEPAIFDCHLIRVSPDSSLVEPLYLGYFFLAENQRRDLVSRATTTTMTTLNQNTLMQTRVILPPLFEQRAIVQVLNTVQEASASRQRELALERERKAALMEFLFTFGIADGNGVVKERTHGRSPSDWDVRHLDDCAFIQTGVAKGRKFNGAEVTTVPYLRVANVQNGYLDLGEMKEITIRKSELARYQLAEGDVVLTEGGDFDKLGRGFVWGGQVAPCVHQNHIFAVRPNRDIVQPDFLAYLVQSPYGRSYFLSVAHKTTNLACINKTKLGRFPVIVPTLDEQQRIANILKACDAKISAQEHEVARLQELFHALLRELLSGQLSVTPLISEGTQA